MIDVIQSLIDYDRIRSQDKEVPRLGDEDVRQLKYYYEDNADSIYYNDPDQINPRETFCIDLLRAGFASGYKAGMKAAGKDTDHGKRY